MSTPSIDHSQIKKRRKRKLPYPPPTTSTIISNQPSQNHSPNPKVKAPPPLQQSQHRPLPHTPQRTYKPGHFPQKNHSKRRRQQRRRTSGLTNPIRTITPHDRSRDASARGDGAESETRATVAGYDDGGAAGLADAVEGGAGGGEGDEGEGEREESEAFEGLHRVRCVHRCFLE